MKKGEKKLQVGPEKEFVRVVLEYCGIYIGEMGIEGIRA